MFFFPVSGYIGRVSLDLPYGPRQRTCYTAPGRRAGSFDILPRRDDLRLPRGEVKIDNLPANLVGEDLEALPHPCEVFGFDLFPVFLAGNIGVPLYPQAPVGRRCGCCVSVLESVMKGHGLVRGENCWGWTWTGQLYSCCPCPKDNGKGMSSSAVQWHNVKSCMVGALLLF